jgi:hypothetical protein
MNKDVASKVLQQDLSEAQVQEILSGDLDEPTWRIVQNDLKSAIEAKINKHYGKADFLMGLI